MSGHLFCGRLVQLLLVPYPQGWDPFPTTLPPLHGEREGRLKKENQWSVDCDRVERYNTERTIPISLVTASNIVQRDGR
jgi:hypothetical protein